MHVQERQDLKLQLSLLEFGEASIRPCIFRYDDNIMRPTLAREIASSIASATRTQSLCAAARLQRSQRLTALTRQFSASSHHLQDNGTTASHQVRQTTFSPRAPAPATASAPSSSSSPASTQPLRSLTEGLDDPPPILGEDERQVDWTRSFHGLSAEPFSPEARAILTADLDFDDIEIKPDGIVYLPEIKYRRILNKAFGPGGWGLAPRGETIVTGKIVTREYGLVCGGR